MTRLTPKPAEPERPGAVERERWIKLCRGPLDSGGDPRHEPEIPILEERLNWIADDMETQRPQDTAEAERAIWCAMFRDLTAFQDKDQDGAEAAIDLLYEIASDMEGATTQPARPE